MSLTFGISSFSYHRAIHRGDMSVKQFLDRVSDMGFVSAEINPWEQCLPNTKEFVAMAEEKGQIIALENHGDFRAEDMRKLLKEINILTCIMFFACCADGNRRLHC